MDKSACPCHPQAASPAEHFARTVASQLQNGVLRYSARARLLEAAEGMGLGRFQANLIIAAVQHQAGPASHEPTSPRPGIGRFGLGVIVLLIQIAILLAARGLWFR